MGTQCYMDAKKPFRGGRMAFKGIIFDFNGVLWWDGPLQVESWQRCAHSLRGRFFSEEELDLCMHGRTNRDVFSYLMGREVGGGELATLIHRKESAYRQGCLSQGERFALSSGAAALLAFLMDCGIPHTIATSSERTNLDFFVEHLELSKWFTIPDIVYDDGTLPGKPAPDIYLRAAANLGLKPAECVVVEDAHSGIQAARAARIGHIIAIGPRSTHDRLRGIEGVNEVVENLGQIRKEGLLDERRPATRHG
jgi:beta-phosphoglucomutase-like phosphatase (HAD superfamily)